MILIINFNGVIPDTIYALQIILQLPNASLIQSAYNEKTRLSQSFMQLKIIAVLKIKHLLHICTNTGLRSCLVCKQTKVHKDSALTLCDHSGACRSWFQWLASLPPVSQSAQIHNLSSHFRHIPPIKEHNMTNMFNHHNTAMFEL